ncbi:MAG: UDP-N-acetylmuramoyl-L-alanine--D-glutamate ligase, partial [Bacteroidaceae bacterium]|nr:UDP-N-acetylmuramoyl-L-alanine--D-glutamate ligase [Bacteroidaceae bacterium]
MKLVVLGAAESGVGAAILAQQKGYEVFVTDNGPIKDKFKATLDQYHIEWEEGGHTLERVMDADEVVKSPGIPDTVPVVRAFLEKGTPILSEIEFAGRYTDAKMLCITGSNGKTTTTSLIYHILKKAGYDVGLAGNIGHSLARQVAESPREWYVLELSSFQLDNMYDFRADIAVLLNITPDHLDRYDFCMQNYVESKMRILQNQRPEDTF